MICKICESQNVKLRFRLTNARVFVCDDCNFHFTDYLDPPISQYFKEDDSPPSQKIIDYLTTQLQYNHSRFENQAQLVKQFISGKEHFKILDVGCGGGLFLSLVNINDVNCYGIEPDIDRLKYSRQASKLKNIYPYPIDSDFWNQDHKNSFDAITLWDVIEHVNDPKSLLTHAASLLKKDGIILIDTPCRDTFYHKFGSLSYKLSFGKFPAFLNIMYSNNPYGHKQILSKDDMDHLSNELNLKIIKFDLFHELSFPIEYYIRKLFKSGLLQTISIPLITFFSRHLRIRNKMLVVLKKF
jgi:2-polyprenyl-3-methyl-5-hydroxy-6-metoxy-1,4-benzoquinol methylase